MNNKIRIILAVAIPSIIMLGFCNSVKKTSKQGLVNNVLRVMKYQHYKPLEINDTFSKRVFNLFIKQLDERKIFFSAKDIKKLEKFKYSIDDEVKTNDFHSYDEIVRIYKERIIEVEQYSTKAFESKVNLNQKSMFTVPDEASTYSSNAKELANYWHDYQTFLILDNYTRKVLNQEEKKSKSDSFQGVSNDSLKRKAIQEVTKNQKEWFKRLKRLKDKEYFDMFVGCMTQAFDPHSGYYPPRQKEDFDIRLSGQFEGIGASLSERDGYIKVEQIIPGSASYRQGELKKGDYIIAVAQGEDEAVSVVDMALSDVVQLIRGKKGTTVKLTVKKPDETETSIPIIRDVVVLEEGYAKSGIIDDTTGKYGYINLPSFYADFNKRNGRSSAEDIAKEVMKLKKNSISGLVIDLRYNGGGSLRDVVEMVGLFTGKGPAVQIKSKTGNPDVYESHTPEPLYDGPLVILVNYYSASASEILAAALQDYKRAVIVGTKHTFGKGTVQRFIDLGSIFGDDADGSVKLTTQKFYRVNGKTTQFRGVIPDVIMPDRFDYYKIGERKLPYALKDDELKAAIKNKRYSDLMKETISNAQMSVDANKFLQKQGDIALNLNERNKKKSFQLNFNSYKNYLLELQNKQQMLDSVQPSFRLKLVMPSQDSAKLSADSIQFKVRQEWLGRFTKDAYLFESCKILNNLQ
jgi:carboxyl-terminal processing protease